MTPFPARLERFAVVDSTQRIVREWLAARVPEVCVAVAGEQTAGRGRAGRTWQAPAGAGLLLSAGFRPRDLAPRHAWRLGAIVGLAMLDAAEEQGLRDGTLGLKWPNDLVADGPEGLPRKRAGVLGETASDPGGGLASAVVGIGLNVDWSRDRFPPDLAPGMTSLRELLGRPADREVLLGAFLARLEPRYEALRADHFDVAGWSARQRTTGALVEVAVGPEVLIGRGAGVDPESGALLLEVAGSVRPIDSGEVLRCRLIGRPEQRVARAGL
ncbi:MAG: biotin--[acetyl-CoA-carboxylase] ligase [Candidatus Limnocylindrales bacterium]